MKLELNPPVKVGDKVFVSNKSFGQCNFLERYSKYTEETVTGVKCEVDIETGEVKYTYKTDNPNNNYWYIYTGKIHFTKESLFESFREEIEQLIPSELRNYLWGVQ